MGGEKFTAWVTKYALTEGIQVVDATPLRVANMILYDGRYAHGKEWHRTEADALARAAEMRESKLNSLKRQIETLESMDIKINDERAVK